MAAAAVHFPGSLDRGPLERVRRPLAVLAALLLVVDLIGLGMHLADGVTSPFASDSPAGVKARIDTPEAVVPGSVLGTQTNRQTADRSRAAEPLGCLSASSGCYSPPATPSPGTTTPPTTPGTPPVPLAQADAAVPALGAQVSLGLGDGGCTGITLTVLDIGGCGAATGEGPIVLNLGGSLLGD